ncbi:hypothetical protein BC936DRAFT_148504 [Jimgerdemannia flammicorona]|uniref:Uncharacterized protein n=1 Tax=Jimgerdemannia flammicorona TaxID=994334 RepID=A0A433D2Y8_9FUNG|nr:hypothetical protein BC936DRAFT_148504 [Jimgerdemannia flammicorona]
MLAFSTNAGTWTANNATGNTPVARRMHTAVLVHGLNNLLHCTRAASDGFSIIICCGGTQSDDVNLNDVAVLDTRTWLWMQPATNGSVPTGRFAPSSVMVNGQMLIFFGYDNNGKGLNDVAILDTRSTQHYQWASSFFPNSSPPSSSTENIGGSSGTGGIDAIGGIGGIVGIVIGVLILVAILVFLLVRKPWRARSDSEFRQEQDAPHRGAPPTGPQQQFNPINQKPDQYNQEPDQDNRKPNQYNQESDQNNQKPDVDDRLNEIEI